jgi:hypothetical protein
MLLCGFFLVVERRKMGGDDVSVAVGEPRYELDIINYL